MSANNLSFRFARPDECDVILDLVRQLADYEQLLDEVTATTELFHEWIFQKKKAEVLFAEVDGEIVGMALFFHNFSTFLGKAGIYLEDLFVKPQHQGKGYGTAILKSLAAIAVERGCGRLEWWCLDRNHPAIKFYTSLGAVPMDEWTTYRITGETLTKMAKR